MPLSKLPILKIKIRNRYRRELGDIQALATTIKELGLLHPIVEGLTFQGMGPDQLGVYQAGVSGRLAVPAQRQEPTKVGLIELQFFGGIFGQPSLPADASHRATPAIPVVF